MQTNFTDTQLADPATRRSNEILRSCVHCGFCTATCPTYKVLGDELDSPRGRIYLIKDMAERSAYNFPVIREAIGHADALYGFKSGFDRDSLALGLKSGGFWPNNVEKGLANHQSTVFLFDADTGGCRAVVGGNLLTALRTAAASAVSIKYLARNDAKVLGMGHLR